MSAFDAGNIFDESQSSKGKTVHNVLEVLFHTLKVANWLGEQGVNCGMINCIACSLFTSRVAWTFDVTSLTKTSCGRWEEIEYMAISKVRLYPAFNSSTRWMPFILMYSRFDGQASATRGGSL